MPSRDSLVRQVGDFVVVALFFFALTAVLGPLEPFLMSVGIDPPWFLGAVVAGGVGVVLLVARPLRLRLVVRVWAIGLVTTVVTTTLFVFFDLQESPLGILVAWALGVGLGLVLAYPPFWRAAEARVRVEEE
ncbi:MULTISPECIES: hypothetical protein [Haloferax]|uniref:Uncharacterized protein n=1 Tax=Haloferax marinum TaxID=2666143 RepID=A0A6A8G6G8_9EURY|nr:MULTISPECIES: hypothetical protein [Haloferax]KAB1197637.1 hypothetical protein Hfx1150_08935 [Haloferax sp. CBA1150]MRW96689.1 hypothetical protein [Haloferax marinum]